MRNTENNKLHTYIGAIHIHSKFSDGTGDVESISRAAKKAGLDWIIVTDHNNLDIEEGFFNGVCVIRGEEITPNGCNHYLVLGVNKVFDWTQSPQDFVNEVRKLGGFGFAAHPDEVVERNSSFKAIRWLDKNVKPDGVEIWNWFSSWADNYSDEDILSQAFSYIFRNELVMQPSEETMRWWDELNKYTAKIVPAIGGVDAHALIFKDYLIPIKIFPYKSMFKTISNVVYLENELSDNFSIAKTQILNAIENGNNLIINRKVCNKIPEIKIYNSCKSVIAGKIIELDDETFFEIKLSKMFDVRLFCDGVLILDKNLKEICIPLKRTGKYRVEISSNDYGYIYTNPILVK